MLIIPVSEILFELLKKTIKTHNCEIRHIQSSITNKENILMKS